MAFQPQAALTDDDDVSIGGLTDAGGRCSHPGLGKDGIEGVVGKAEGQVSTGFVAHCPHCRRETLFVHARVRHRRHLLLVVVTAGLWSIVWMALVIGKCMRPWRCAICGWHKPEFRK